MAKTRTSFKVGGVANPKGRPPLTPAQRKAREMRAQCQPEVVKELLAIAKDKEADTKDRVACLKALLEDLPAQVEVSDVGENAGAGLTRAQLIAAGLGVLQRIASEEP